MPLSCSEISPACKTPLDHDGKTTCSVSQNFKSTKSSTLAVDELDLPSSKRYKHNFLRENIVVIEDSKQKSIGTNIKVQKHPSEKFAEDSSLSKVENERAEGSSPDEKSVDANLLTWAQCDLCSKWRQLPSGINIDQNTTFSCTDVAGWNCDMPEEQASGQFELPQSPKDVGSALPSEKSKAPPSAQSQSHTSKKVLCPNCGVGVQALEDHYRLSPQCQPSREITPYWVSGLVLDLSDRIPYRAVTHKDLRIWRKFASRARSCSTYRSATRQLLWLYEQLRPAVLCQGWLAARQEQFRRDCESCDDPQLAVQLVNQVELEAIDWVEIHRLWAQERGADAAAAAAAAGLAEENDRFGPDETKNDKLNPAVQRSCNSISKRAENDRQKRKNAARARWDRCKAAHNAAAMSQTLDPNGSKKAGTEVLHGDFKGSAQSREQHLQETEDAYTLGSLVEITLDDGEQAVAIITALPELLSSDAVHYEVTFLDSQGLIVNDDRIRLPLPNRFVSLTLACPPCDDLPTGWIPAAAGPSVCYYIAPDGRVCKTKQEMLQHAENGAPGAVCEPQR